MRKIKIKYQGYGLFLILSSLVGLLAAFSLTVEKIHKLINPNEAASCDFSILVQCGKNLESWQGSLFGFPNPLIGLIGWSIVLTIGVGFIANIRYPRWWHISLNIGLVAALGFCIWLMYQSIYVLNTLCPWCMVTWGTTIAALWVVTLWNIKHGHWNKNLKAKIIGEKLLGWAPTFILLTYGLIALIAQLELDWIKYL